MTEHKDMPETWIIDLEADLNVLEHLVETYDHAGATDEQLAVAWSVQKLHGNVHRIKRYLYEKWHDERSGWQASTPAPAKPEPANPADPVHGSFSSGDLPDDPEKRWRQLYGRWLSMQAEWVGEPEQERADALTYEEGPIVCAMASTSVPRRFLEQKLEVLDHVLFHDHQSSWADRRDELLLNSIKADVKALS